MSPLAKFEGKFQLLHAVEDDTLNWLETGREALSPDLAAQNEMNPNFISWVL